MFELKRRRRIGNVGRAVDGERVALGSNLLIISPTINIIESHVELPIAVTTWVCAGEVLEVEEREKGLAGKEGQQSGEVSAS